MYRSLINYKHMLVQLICIDFGRDVTGRLAVSAFPVVKPNAAVIFCCLLLYFLCVLEVYALPFISKNQNLLFLIVIQIHFLSACCSDFRLLSWQKKVSCKPCPRISLSWPALLPEHQKTLVLQSNSWNTSLKSSLHLSSTLSKVFTSQMYFILSTYCKGITFKWLFSKCVKHI